LTVPIYFDQDLQVTSLGAVIGQRSTTFQMALYSDTSGRPDTIVVQTTHELSYTSAEEIFATPQRVTSGNYWLAILAGGASPESLYVVIENEYVQGPVYYDWANRTSWPTGASWAATLLSFHPSAPYVSILPHIYAGTIPTSANASK
jgi:hypothetical protein